MGRASSSSNVDFHNLPRRKLQQMCKKHGIPANKTNLFMANALIELMKQQQQEQGCSSKDGDGSTMNETSDCVTDDNGNVGMEVVTPSLRPGGDDDGEDGAEDVTKVLEPQEAAVVTEVKSGTEQAKVKVHEGMQVDVSDDGMVNPVGTDVTTSEINLKVDAEVAAIEGVSDGKPMKGKDVNGEPDGEDVKVGVPDGEDVKVGVPDGEDVKVGVPDGEDVKVRAPAGEDVVPDGEVKREVVPDGELVKVGVPEGEDVKVGGVPSGENVNAEMEVKVEDELAKPAAELAEQAAPTDGPKPEMKSEMVVKDDEPDAPAANSLEQEAGPVEHEHEHEVEAGTMEKPGSSQVPEDGNETTDQEMMEVSYAPQAEMEQAEMEQAEKKQAEMKQAEMKPAEDGEKPTEKPALPEVHEGAKEHGMVTFQASGNQSGTSSSSASALDCEPLKEIMEKVIRRTARQHRAEYKPAPLFNIIRLNRSLKRARSLRNDVLTKHRKSCASAPKAVFGRKRFLERAMAQSARRRQEKLLGGGGTPTLSPMVEDQPIQQQQQPPPPPPQVEDHQRNVSTPCSKIGAEHREKRRQQFKTPIKGLSKDKAIELAKTMGSVKREMKLRELRGMNVEQGNA